MRTADLEDGNASKGLAGGTGRPAQGDWRLVLTSALGIEAMAYIRTSDGLLTAMHDVAPAAEGVGHAFRVVTFNPASNRAQESLLRLVHPGSAEAVVTIWGVDDRGRVRGPVHLRIPARASRTLSSVDLEEGAAHMDGALGDGQGKWRLHVKSSVPLLAMSLLASPTGHLTNLSTVGHSAISGGLPLAHLPFFPAAGNARGWQGFVRVANGTGVAGWVLVFAVDDAGGSSGPLAFELDAGETMHFNSRDLEDGNPAKGLAAAIGKPGQGDWRLLLVSEHRTEAMAYIRTSDGLLTAMHDFEPVPGDGNVGRVVTFNPGSNYSQQSLLRLVNAGGAEAAITITGVDDEGRSAGPVRLGLPAEASRTVSARELEEGADGLDGTLGDGVGKWRLNIEADVSVLAMSLLASPTGHLTNLSTVPILTAGALNAPDGIYEVGETLAFEDAVPGYPSEGSLGFGTDSPTEIELPYRAYFHWEHLRFTCQSAGGCFIRDGEVIEGSILQTTREGRHDDHGDTRTTATPVALGSDTPGVLDVGDIDWFRVDVDRLGALEVYTGGFVDTTGRLERGGGELISSNDDSDVDNNFIISAHVSPGVYYVGVQGFDNGTTGEYTLHARFTETDVRAFQLDSEHGNAHGIAFANGRFHIVDLVDGRVYAYTASGRRDPAADFDLHQDNGNPTGIAFGNGRFHVVDWLDARIYAYTASGRRDPAADFDLHQDNGSASGIAFANERLHVVDLADDKVYAYTASGQRDPAGDFDLHHDNGIPTGIAFADGLFHIVDSEDDKAYAYTTSGQHDPAADFDLHQDNGNPTGIAFGSGRFHVVDWWYDRVYAYTASGQHDPAADFDLPESNGDPTGIAFANGRIHVVDWADDKVYAYTASGRRDPAGDFDLHQDNGSPTGIAFANGRFHVVDWWDDKVYAYSASGQHDPAADFDLYVANGSATGIAFANERFHIVDRVDAKVYAYAASGSYEPEADFDLYADNGNAEGIAFTNGRFHVVNSIDNKVYAYAASGWYEREADFDLPEGDGSSLVSGISYADGRFHVVDASSDAVYSLALAGTDTDRGGAWGAISVDFFVSLSCPGLAAGIALNEPTEEAALAAASAGCQTDGGSRSECTFESYSFTGCAALAYGTLPGDCRAYPGGLVTSVDTISAAESDALDRCRNDGATGCRIWTNGMGQRISGCNISAADAPPAVSRQGNTATAVLHKGR